MTDTTPFTDSIIAGLNNPECSFWVGSTVGNWLAFRWVVLLFVVMLLFKVVEKLAVEPLIQWAKKKLKKEVQK